MPTLRRFDYNDAGWGERPRTIHPRPTGYKHKPCICVIDGKGFVPATGEYVDNLAEWLWKTLTPYVLVMTSQYEAAIVVNLLTEEYGDDPAFSITFTESYNPDAGLVAHHPKPQCIGFDRKINGEHYTVRNRKKTARHRFLVTEVMSPANTALVNNTYESLAGFYSDFSEWHRENDVPMGNTVAAVGGRLLTDKRFWPESRGRVPRATNEALRTCLPGVEQELHGKPGTRHEYVVAFDQKRSYHRVAQSVPVPHPNDLYARGYFQNPDDTRIWARAGTPFYDRVIAEHGSLYVMATSRPLKRGEFRPKAWNFKGYQKLHLWTNEVQDAISTGIQIRGIVCARTCPYADTGLSHYGEWAEHQINTSDQPRREWLKPALHSLYGLLGSRVMISEIHSTSINGESSAYFAGREYSCNTAVRTGEHPCTNVATLGILQAEMRARTNRKASELHTYGFDVLHTHADGLHAAPPQQPKLRSPDPLWSEESRTRLIYLDEVSWLSDEGHTLPGRDQGWRLNELPRLLEQIKLATGTVNRKSKGLVKDGV